MAIQQQVYDDGSVFTWDDQTGFRSAAPALEWQTVNRQSASWAAGAVQPAAEDWGDVLKFGFARLIDAKTRPVQPSNTTAVLAPANGGAMPAAFSGSALPWIIAGGVVLALVFMGSKGA